MEELLRKIEELENSLREKDNTIINLTNRVNRIYDTLLTHTHDGSDGSSEIYSNKLDLKIGQPIKTGQTSLEYYDFMGTKLAVWNNGLSAGKGEITKELKDSIQVNSQLVGNDSFFYAFSSPSYSTVSGTISDKDRKIVTLKDTYNFGTDYLVNCKFIAYTSDLKSFFTYNIIGNTNRTITLSESISSNIEQDFIFDIVKLSYLGASVTPWRRLYVGENTDGGIRFGSGATGNGQNALLYYNPVFDRLEFKGKNGNIITIT